jgi:hypothetical protein
MFTASGQRRTMANTDCKTYPCTVKWYYYDRTDSRISNGILSMKTATIINKICSLPREQRMFIVEKVIHSIRKDENSSEKGKKPMPNNPSPSGDPWFDDPQNLAMLNERVREMKDGKISAVRLETKEDIRNFFKNL